MESFINYSILLNLYLILLLACYQWGIRQTTNFQLSRLFLLIGVGISIFLPFIKLTLNSETLAQIPSFQLQESFIQAGTESSTSSGTSIASWLIMMYFIGLSISASRIIYGMYQVFELKRNCKKVAEYYEIPNSNAAFSFMRSIFIGENLTEEQKEVVLKHEKIHLSKFHYIDLILVQLLEVFLFYNPFAYRVNSLFKEVHEYEADYYSAEKQESYIAHLLSKHFEIKEFSIVHQFNSNHLKSRIMRIKNREKHPANPAAIIMTILLFGGVFLLNQNIVAQNESDNATYKNVSNAKESNEGVDQEAEYPGGLDAFIKYISENTKYPKSEKENGISGTVYLEFTISSNGDIESINVLRGIKDGEALDQEAVRVLKSVPKKWKPAMKDGKAVAVKMTMPLRFELPKKEEKKKDN